MPMETGNVDVVLMPDTANECKAAAENLARYLDTGLPATRRVVDRERAIGGISQ